MKKNKEKIVMGIALVALVLVTVGISYAAFTYIGQGQRENTITTGNLTFVYDESNKSGNGISIENATPTSDDLGKVSVKQGEVFEFSVTASTKGAPIYYEIYTTKQDSSTLPEKIIKTYLTTVQGEEETGVPNILTNETINTYNKLGISQVPEQENGRTLYQEMIPEGQDNYSKTFRYRMWISDTATEVDENGVWKYNDKSFTVKVNVYASNEKIGDPVAPPSPFMKTWTVNSTEDFHAEEYRTKITNVKFSDTTQVPNTAIQSWDISAVENSGQVMAWIENVSRETESYTLTIGGDGGVATNNLAFFLQNFTALNSIDFTNLDTSGVTDMSGMFAECSNLTSLDLSDFKTSNVTNMRGMFNSCTNLAQINFGGIDTSNVTDMSQMFLGCSGLTSLDLSNFNTSKVTNMSYMFSHTGLTSLDLSSLDTSKVVYMNNMFELCTGLVDLNLDGVDTSNVTNMSWMFNSCTNLVQINLGGIDTSNVTDMSGMFYNCGSLASLDLSNFNTSSVTNMSSMFFKCSGLKSLDLSNFNTSRVIFVTSMFWHCSSLVSLNLESANFSRVSANGSAGMFSGVNGVQVIVRDEKAKVFIEERLLNTGNSDGVVTIA